MEIELKKVSWKKAKEILRFRIHDGINDAENGLLLAGLFLKTANPDGFSPNSKKPGSLGDFFMFKGEGLHCDYGPRSEGFHPADITELIRILPPSFPASVIMRLHIRPKPDRFTGITTQLVLYDSLCLKPEPRTGTETLSFPLVTTNSRIEFQAIDNHNHPDHDRISMHVFPENKGVDMDTHFGLWLSAVVLPTYGRLLKERKLLRLDFEPVPEKSTSEIPPYTFD